MGIYLNPGNEGFEEAIRSEIYVDKTGLIVYTNKYLNTEQKFICVSRPRRFGKSMALRMLAAYYSRGCDSGELFGGLEIESDPAFRDHLNQYDVIFLNMQQFLIGAKDQRFTDYLEREVLEEIWEEYGDILSRRDAGLAKIYMDMDFDGLRADIAEILGGGHVKVSTLSFQNDMCNLRSRDDVLTLLIHLGYLAYDSEREEVFIPNREIAREFENAMSAGGAWFRRCGFPAADFLHQACFHCRTEV